MRFGPREVLALVFEFRGLQVALVLFFLLAESCR